MKKMGNATANFVNEPLTDLLSVEERAITELVRAVQDLKNKPLNVYSQYSTSYPLQIDMKIGAYSATSGVTAPTTPDQYIKTQLSNRSTTNLKLDNIRSYKLDYSVGTIFNPFLRGTVYTPTDFSTTVHMTIGIYDEAYDYRRLVMGVASPTAPKSRTFLSMQIGTLTYNASSGVFLTNIPKTSLELSNTIERPFVSFDSLSGVYLEDFISQPGTQLDQQVYEQLVAGDFNQLIVSISVSTQGLSATNTNFLTVDVANGLCFFFTPTLELVISGNLAVTV